VHNSLSAADGNVRRDRHRPVPWIGGATFGERNSSQSAARNRVSVDLATSGEISASSSSTSTYNSFVTSQAAPLTAILPAGVTWDAVVSTGASPNDAKDNAPSFANIPIYNTDGLKVSAGSLYSGASLLSDINFDQNGNTPPIDLIWTGATALGAVSSNPLGSSDPEFGNSTATSTSWITGSSGDPASIVWPVYALSSPITVVPEPTTLSLLGVALLGLGGFFFTRRRRKTPYTAIPSSQ
jgi:hypothetical protein